jgi:hypothetical protein
MQCLSFNIYNKLLLVLRLYFSIKTLTRGHSDYHNAYVGNEYDTEDDVDFDDIEDDDAEDSVDDVWEDD